MALEGGEPRRVASIDGSIGPFAFSRDGRRIAFIGTANAQPERSYDQPDLWLVDRTGGTPRNLTTGYDFDMGGAIGGDQRAPRGQLPAAPIWSADGNRVFVRVGEQGNAVLAAVDAATGKVERTIAAQDLMSYTADAAAARFAMVISTPTVLGDLFVSDGPSGAAPRKLTTFNDALFAELKMNEPEEIWYPSFDGRRMQGWILKPPDFDPRKKYPLVLQIHGGPHSAYGNTFTHEFQWMAAKGYVVLYTNPRGSSNYGQEFGNIIQFKYPGDDYKDLMAGVDAVLKTGYIDDKRMGVTGGSGGGLLTNWVVTQTTRFKAAVEPARHLGLDQLLVHRRLHAVHADLVPQGAVRGSGGVHRALAHHLRHQDPDPADVHPRRRGLPHAAVSRRRGSVPGAEVSQAADGDGALPRREPRTVPQRPALAPRRTPPAHRRMVREILPACRGERPQPSRFGRQP